MADEGKEKTRREIILGKREFLPAELPDDQYVLVITESDWPYKVENRI